MKKNKYQICEKEVYLGKSPKFNENNFHAGGKAPSDVVRIAINNDYKKIYIRKLVGGSPFFCKIIRKFLILDWILLYFRIKNNSILLIQTPVRWGRLSIRNFFLQRLRLRKKVSIISLMHDIEPLRKNLYLDDESFNRAKEEYELTLKTSDYLITHNFKMKSYLVSCGVDISKIIELEIFDYLLDEKLSNKIFKKCVIYAGNLSQRKSPFLADIGNLGVNFDLYGINYDKELYDSSKVNYKGFYPSDILPIKFIGGFGLVWDGDSSEMCSGMGDYLRWNNPHKLSLYLVSGLPVFIWKEAAAAKFVEDNNVGFLISKLSDIKNILNEITEKQYKELHNNVLLISEKLRSGYFTGKALKSIEKQIEM